MPSTKKKSPASAAKKKSLASTKAKNSVKKSTKKNSTSKNDGSYLQVAPTHASPQKPVSTVDNLSMCPQSEEGLSASTGQAILEMLHKLDASNQALTKRMDSLERQGSVSSTPVGSPTSHRPGVEHVTNFQQGRGITSTGQPGPFNAKTTPAVPLTIPESMRCTSGQCAQAGVARASVQAQLTRDAVVSKLDVMRSIPSVSSAVSRLLAQYNDQADQEALPGKTSSVRKRSGRYNITDTSLVGPQYRWPNEGLVSNSHITKPAYDELSMAQWASGQLCNMSLVDDNATLRNMLSQMSMAMRDAISLPWSAVRSAWAVSMTEIEEGRLLWSDSMQWSLNRISNSQLAVLNSNSVVPSGQKIRICRFYNEGSCNNDTHHGAYRHFCSICYKQGRSLTHPEFKCSSRTSGRTQEQRVHTK